MSPTNYRLGATFTGSNLLRPTAITGGAADGAEAPVAWDPEGLLPSTPAGGHFARRARERAGSVSSSNAPPQARPPPPGPPIRPLLGTPSPEGISPSESSLYNKQEFAAALADRYMPVDLDYPGLRIHHLDPPVFTIEGFFTPEECKIMREAAIGTGRMIESKVGAGNVHGDASVAASSARRTSTSILVDDTMLRDHPELQPSTADLQSRGMKLLGAINEKPWGKSGKLPSPGQYSYEGLQVTRYNEGQYFMEHEDAFPVPLAKQNGFNRHATLLVYLNEVKEGGATRFDHLGLSVSPKEGQALLFFPSFSDGTPDARSLHTATTAVNLKIVTQQWVARGFSAVPLITQQLLKKKEDEKKVAVLEGLLATKKKSKGGGKNKGPNGGGFGGFGKAK